MSECLTSFCGIPEEKYVPNFLFSFALMKSTKSIDRLWRYLSGYPGQYRLLIDSGAFTASRSGISIPLEKFRDFCKSIPKGLHVEIFQLDVMGMPEKTLENYKRLLDWGIVTIPIFQSGGDLKILEECYTYSNLVGIAGVKSDIGYAREVNAMLDGRKAHFLGLTKVYALKEIKPWSSDSLSWRQGTMYARIPFWDVKTEKFIHWDFKKSPNDLEKYALLAKNMGFSREDLVRLCLGGKKLYVHFLEKDWSNSTLRERLQILMPAVSWMLYSRYALSKLNTRVFLSCEEQDFPRIFYAEKYIARLLRK